MKLVTGQNFSMFVKPGKPSQWFSVKWHLKIQVSYGTHSPNRKSRNGGFRQILRVVLDLQMRHFWMPLHLAIRMQTIGLHVGRYCPSSVMHHGWQSQFCEHSRVDTRFNQISLYDGYTAYSSPRKRCAISISESTNKNGDSARKALTFSGLNDQSTYHQRPFIPRKSCITFN